MEFEISTVQRDSVTKKKKILHTPASVFGLYCAEGDKLNNTLFMLHI